MEFSEAELGQFVAGIWEWQLGLEVHRSDRTVTAELGDFSTGCVQISGAWQGVVLLVCSVALTRRTAAIMFGVELDCVTTEQAHDALGELTNIIGGNIKPLLPQPAHLSTPVVVDGWDPTLHQTDRVPLIQMTFEYEGQPFLVAVLQRNAAVGDDAQPFVVEP